MATAKDLSAFYEATSDFIPTVYSLRVCVVFTPEEDVKYDVYDEYQKALHEVISAAHRLPSAPLLLTILMDLNDQISRIWDQLERGEPLVKTEVESAIGPGVQRLALLAGVNDYGTPLAPLPDDQLWSKSYPAGVLIAKSQKSERTWHRWKKQLPKHFKDCGTAANSVSITEHMANILCIDLEEFKADVS